jgi:hypothetical protein
MNNQGIILSVLALLILGLFASIVSLIINLVFTPFLTTPISIVREIIKYMELKSGETLVDLGSGDGRMLIEAHKTANITAIGYELSPILIAIAKLRTLLHRGPTKDITVILENLHKAKLEPNFKVFVFLDEETLQKLSKKFKSVKKLKVYSYKYKIPNIPLTKEFTLMNKVKLYYYYINS